jgi:hypothetical protein
MRVVDARGKCTGTGRPADEQRDARGPGRAGDSPFLELDRPAATQVLVTEPHLRHAPSLGLDVGRGEGRGDPFGHRGQGPTELRVKRRVRHPAITAPASTTID